ncbi:MAG: TonB-dependent receptor [Bacteroidota bacterium]
MKTMTILLFILAIAEAGAQSTISGTVTDRKNAPIPYANIYFRGSYDGAITDTLGEFSYISDASGPQVLVISSVGYADAAIGLTADGEDTSIHVVLEEEMNQLNEVTITAGVFSASDKKKSATLTSFDIATTASAMGDIYGAYATMPGSQKVGEEGMLFVRGGEGYETKTYMDGMLVQSPYFSSMPDIPTRGRFSPLLFSETVFSTGAYSAEFGNALSSVVDLTTNGLEPGDKASIGIMTVGANGSFSKRWENSSLALTGLYANNGLHHRLFKQHVDWISDPVLWDGMAMFRQKIGETGLLKSFISFNSNEMEMNYDNFEMGTMDRIEIKDGALYANTTYSGQLNEKWLIKTGVAYGGDKENLNYNDLPVCTSKSATTAKLVFTHLTSKRVKIRAGSDVVREVYRKSVIPDTVITMQMIDIQASVFIESELKLTNKLALRLGARSGYSSLLDELTLLPRVSAAFKTGEFSQVSMAWGKYRQKPENEYLMFAPKLSPERSDHYVLNFQYRKENRIFRIESYVKRYDDLVKYDALYSPDATAYNNNGFGYARGVDLFWRDQKSLKGVDYWISYSFLNTRRNYKDYPASTVPSYASAHNLSLVYKQFLKPLNTFVGMTYSFASGRPYDDRNSEEFMSGRTKPYNDISLNLTYLLRLFKKECIVHMSMTNLFNFQNEFGYRYSNTPGEDGCYASQAIVPNAGRQAILLLMLSL